MKLYKFLPLLCLLFVGGCLGYPREVTPIKDFELDRYLGKWYELARLDHRFERGLEQVTAEYSLLKDGELRVINRGFDTKNQQWKAVEGRARFVRDNDEGYLKVSFFGPFYGSYVIFDLDRENYRYAMVTGPNKSYLWFLARTPAVSEELLDQFKQAAKRLGFNTDELVYVKH